MVEELEEWSASGGFAWTASLVAIKEGNPKMNDLFETVATIFLAVASLALLGLVALIGYLIYSLITTGGAPG